MRHLLWPLLALLVAPLCATDQDGDAPVIDTFQGRLRGLNMVSRSGRRFHAFLGIPYSPTPARFESSKRYEKWEGERDATKEGNRCPQLDEQGRFVGHEDCLYLNVYTPRLPDPDEERDYSKELAVIVALHGGGFSTGHGGLDSLSPEHLLDHDVVLVTPNYRLGPMGFLATGDPMLPGNYGLKDQFRALSWVRRHIGYFGGSPGKVTLLGQEAGAASAHYHMFTELSKDRFWLVASLSGTALSPWAHVSTHESRRRSFRLGHLLKCPPDQLDDGQGLKECLVGKSAEELVSKAADILDWNMGLVSPFVPVTEPIMPRNRTFVYDNIGKMIQLLGKRRYQPNWLIGTTSGEGVARAEALLKDSDAVCKLNEDPGKYLPLYLGLFVDGGEEMAQSVGHRIWDYYMGDRSLNQETLSNLVEMTSDLITFYGVRNSVVEHTVNTTLPMFVYHFAWDGRDGEHGLGVPQGYDFNLMLPKSEGGKKPTFTEEEYQYVDKLLQLIVNFANEGDPTFEEFPVLDNVMWQDAVDGNFSYLLMDQQLAMKDGGLHAERMAFWEDVLSEVHAAERALELLTREQRQKDNIAWFKAQADAKPPKKEGNPYVKLEL